MLIVISIFMILAAFGPREVMRFTSPDGKVDAVLCYTSGGAVGPHYYSLYILPFRNIVNPILPDGIENRAFTFECGEMPEITWSGNECLTVKYKSCLIENYRKYIDCRGHHIEIKKIDTPYMPTSILRHESRQGAPMSSHCSEGFFPSMPSFHCGQQVFHNTRW